MSSSNLIRVTFIPETVYGTTPGSGSFITARFTSETLSGSPETVESQQIRTDRLSSGQIVTGLTVAGDLAFELAKENSIDELFKSAMNSAWVSDTPVSADLTIDDTAKTITRASGSFATDLVLGDLITTTGFSNSVNNTQFMVTEVVSTTVIKYASSDTVVDEVGSGTTFKVADKIEIGTTKYSFSMEKAYLDLTDLAINYRGMLVGAFNLSVAYGAVATGSFSFVGNDYEPVDVDSDFMTDGRTITAAATSNSMNGSVDMLFIATSSGDTFAEADFCVQSIEIGLDNGLSAQNCIGRVAPQNYILGQASVSVSMSAYFSDETFALLGKKLSQESFAIGFIVKNLDGFYAFYLPSVQVSFDDPASQGQNTDVIISMSGSAKVGPNGESSLRIFKS